MLSCAVLFLSAPAYGVTLDDAKKILAEGQAERANFKCGQTFITFTIKDAWVETVRKSRIRRVMYKNGKREVVIHYEGTQYQGNPVDAVSTVSAGEYDRILACLD